MPAKIRKYSHRTTKIIDGKKYKWYGWTSSVGFNRFDSHRPIGTVAEFTSEPHLYAGTLVTSSGYHLWVPVKVRS